MTLTINTTDLHAHVLPVFWPILWLNLYCLRCWFAKHGANIGAVGIATSQFGVIQVTITYSRADAELTHLRVYEDMTEEWGLDQLGFTAHMFTRANRLKLKVICDLLCTVPARGPLTQPPLEPG